MIVIMLLLLQARERVVLQTWNTVVQIRQKGAKHKRTIFFLEQLLLKHNVCEKAL